jgi:hypothetical protein
MQCTSEPTTTSMPSGTYRGIHQTRQTHDKTLPSRRGYFKVAVSSMPFATSAKGHVRSFPHRSLPPPRPSDSSGTASLPGGGGAPSAVSPPTEVSPARRPRPLAKHPVVPCCFCQTRAFWPQQQVQHGSGPGQEEGKEMDSKHPVVLEGRVFRACMRRNSPQQRRAPRQNKKTDPGGPRRRVGELAGWSATLRSCAMSCMYAHRALTMERLTMNCSRWLCAAHM